MVDVDYRMDRDGLAALLVHEDMAAPLRAAALGGLSMARAIAPDAPPFGQGLKYSFDVDTGVHQPLGGTPRQTAFIYTTDPAGAHKEFGHRASNGRWVEGAHVLKRVKDALRLA